MGIFRRKKLSICCDNCKKKIRDYEFVWIDEHKFCQNCAAEIQGGAPNDLVQSGGIMRGQNFDSHNYEMNIEDIFFVNDKGTILCGTVKKGAVRQGDTVYVGNTKLSVVGIECSGMILGEALCGMNIGLLVNCFTPHIFNVGDVVVGAPEEEKPVKKEVVYEKAQEPQAADKPADTLQTSALSDAQISALKKYALKFLPSTMDTPAAYKAVVDNLAKVIPTINISVMDFGLQNILETNNLGSLSLADVYAMLASEIEKWLGVTNMEKVIGSIASLDDDVVVSAWISLDMFAFALKDTQRTEIDKFGKAILGIIEKRDIKYQETPIPENLSEFDILKKKCFELSKESPNSKELSDLKAELGKMLMEQEKIWVAYDEDFKNIYPYVGINGRMEIFTKEEYAQKAKEFFASQSEGHLNIVQIPNDKIQKFFEDMLYMGILHFNLDNGIASIDMSIESFCPYIGEAYLDRHNRIIRCYLMRYTQAVHRYNKISDSAKKEQSTSLYRTILGAFLSNGITALANGIVYALGPGPYTPGATLYTRVACDKLKAENIKQGIFDEKFMISQGDTTFGTVEGLNGVETIKNPSLGEFVAVFTDKASADKMRLDFKNFGAEYDYNIVAVTFDEVVKYAVQHDGMIVDAPSYGHIIDKQKLIDVLNQMSDQRR